MPPLSAKEATSHNDIKGKQRPLPGKYHVAISHWDEKFEKVDAVKVTFTVLDGDVPGQVGRELQESFFVKDQEGNWSTDRIARLAMCIGLLKPGEELDADLTDAAIGRQLVIEIASREYEDKKEKDSNGKPVKKTTVNIANGGYATWPVDDPLVAAVPKNSNALRNRNATTPANNGNGGGNSEPKQSSGWDDV